MVEYPTINWRSGQLRPYESHLSLISRFCAINRISLQVYEQYTGYKIELEGPLRRSKIKRIAILLNESWSLLESTFFPKVTLDHCGRYDLPSVKSDLNQIRYCADCAKFGYHSYLHEAEWLTKCAFHMTDLLTCRLKPHGGRIMLGRLAALKEVMSKNCDGWPRANTMGFDLDSHEHFKLLTAWIKSARKAATRISQREIWQSDQDRPFNSRSLAQAIGKLCALKAMPKEIEPLFTEIEHSWQVKIKQFPLNAKDALHRLKEIGSFQTIFGFYKILSAASPNPPPFLTKLQMAQDSIRERHAKCNCCWGRLKDGWHEYWVKTDPSGWPHFGCTCPYAVAVEELELGWGRSELVLSSRRIEHERCQFIKQTKIMHDAGLIKYLPAANVSPEGYLYSLPQIWPCCEWRNDSPLTELLNSAAEFEIELAVLELNCWLKGISKGASPETRNVPPNCIQLRELDAGLALIKWEPLNEAIQHH